MYNTVYNAHFSLQCIYIAGNIFILPLKETSPSFMNRSIPATAREARESSAARCVR